MFVKPIVYDGSFQRKMGPGDVLAQGEIISGSGLATAGAGILTAAIMLTGMCIRTGPTGAYNDTTDTASNIIAALQGGPAGSAPSPGDTFRFRHLNTVAYVMTLVAGTGVTLGTVPATTLQASMWKEYLVTLTNTTPTTTVAANFTTGTKVITGMTLAQTNAISIGQLVTGTSVGAASVVTSIQPGIGCNVSVNSTGTVVGGAITFSPTVRIDAITMG
jgi:hypothetical protein